VDNAYRRGEELGHGSFSVVYRGTHKKELNDYALKIISKDNLFEADIETIKCEISILLLLRGGKRNLRFFEVYDEPDSYCLVTELITGGELFDRIVSKKFYSEKEARDACRIIIEAVQYVHKSNVIHRDIKPENLLLRNEDDDTDLILSDFGFSKTFKKDGFMSTKCGTPEYVAPEIILLNHSYSSYGTKVDMWSVGVIAYIILCGYPPFPFNDYKELAKMVVAGRYKFPNKDWQNVSKDAKSFVKGLLQRQPELRMSCDEALRHGWIREDGAKLKTFDRSDSLKKLKQNFKPTKTLASVAKTVIAMGRFRDSLHTMKKKIGALKDRKQESLRMMEIIDIEEE